MSKYDRLLAALRQLESNVLIDQTALEQHKTEIVEKETHFASDLRTALRSLRIRAAGDLKHENYPYFRYDLTDPLKTTEWSGGMDAGRRTRDRTIRELVIAFREEKSATVFRPDDAVSEIQGWLKPFRNTGAELVSIRLGGIQSAGRKQMETYFDLKIPADRYKENEARIREEMKELRIQPRITNDTNPIVVSVDLRLYGDEIPCKGRDSRSVAGATHQRKHKTNR